MKARKRSRSSRQRREGLDFDTWPWGFSETGERALLSVCLGMRETEQDWTAFGRDSRSDASSSRS